MATPIQRCGTRRLGLCTHFAGEHYQEQMENLLNQETEQGSQPPTQLEITQQVLGTKPGYYRGLGYGPKPPQSSRTSKRVNQEVLEEVTQLREEVQELQNRKGEIEEVTQLREEVQEVRGIRDKMHQYRQIMEKM
ncbi:hypothetical protein FNV43_RR16831 [Rhamnella rubrinervis]|uniref:Uncharacterized protein n=1 Tax=Rhamnella rubrinervis TaxID=2594499 RepID=A0A8K0ME16_9ROSA|nr:hypothetical protein FNV43_RR16831 [Rhamnella rubrinervis]